MKSKLAASICPLSAAVWNGIRTSNSSRSMVAPSGHHNSHLQVRHCSLSRDADENLKLFKNHCMYAVLYAHRNLILLEKDWLAGPILQIRPKSKAAMSTLFSASPTSRPKPGENGGASYHLMTLVKIPTWKVHAPYPSRTFVLRLSLYELVEAISVFGKVTGALFVNASNGLKCCQIKFESVDSSQQTSLAGKISVGSQEYPVHPLDAVDVLAVRIKNISQNTSDHDIHRTFKSLGGLVRLARTSKDSVDAYFNVRSDIHLNILKRLNTTVIDGCGWSADTLRSNILDEVGRCKLESQIYDQISEMRRQYMTDKINLEDLETLLFSILYIRRQAPQSDAN